MVPRPYRTQGSLKFAQEDATALGLARKQGAELSRFGACFFVGMMSRSCWAFHDRLSSRCNKCWRCARQDVGHQVDLAAVEVLGDGHAIVSAEEPPTKNGYRLNRMQRSLRSEEQEKQTSQRQTKPWQESQVVCADMFKPFNWNLILDSKPWVAKRCLSVFAITVKHERHDQHASESVLSFFQLYGDVNICGETDRILHAIGQWPALECRDDNVETAESSGLKVWKQNGMFYDVHKYLAA